MKKYKTIAFDCFGTLAYISNPKHPYKQLLQRKSRESGDPRTVMTKPVTLWGAAQEFGIRMAPWELAMLEKDLEQELASIRLYPETREVLGQLFLAGYQIAVCSNLALPYAEPVKRLIGDLLGFQVWSFEVGALKPSPDIYASLLKRCDSTASETLMVGDSSTADYEGARALGLDALHLVRDTIIEHPWQIASMTGVIEALR